MATFVQWCTIFMTTWYGLVCNNTWCDYSSTTPHNPHNSVLPLLLSDNLCMYIWVMVLLYYVVCVVVYGMNIMMHIESTNYCILHILRVCRWVLNSHWVLEVSKFSIESTCRWKTAQISVCIYCAVIFTCSLGISSCLMLLIIIGLLNLLMLDF